MTPPTAPPIRVLVVDDEELARRKVVALLSTEPDMVVAGECDSGVAAVDAIRAARPDLVFLDVQMPHLDGFGVVAAIGVEQMPVVVFVTAYDAFALQAFDANAQDYLLKPFDAGRFGTALERARRAVHHRRTEQALPGLAALLSAVRPAEAYPERFLVRKGEQYVFVRTHDVDWVESADNYLVLHVGTQRFMLRETMAAIEARLPPRRFLRIRRGAIINLDRVAALRPYSGTEYQITLTTGVTLISGRRYRQQVREALFT